MIEISIVMIVIGLLVGGVLAGYDLVRIAQLRSVITEIEQFKTAVHTFRAKYGALPGDMRDAETIWGSDVSCPSTPYTVSPHTETCNGDGNGAIGDHGWAVNDFRESYRVSQHLANAGFIAGQYSGTASTATGPAVVGVNTMSSRIASGVGYFPLKLHDNVAVLGAVLYYPGYYGHSIMLGKYSSIFDITVDAALSGNDAAWIDTKIDDGKAGAGNVLTFVQGNGFISSNCATTPSEETAVYTNSVSIECSLVFRRQF